MVLHRHQLPDEELALLQPCIPTIQPRSRYYNEHRHLLLNGMVFHTRTGISWRDLPERYEPCPP